MRRFCYRCGVLENERGPLVAGLCQRCFTRENRLLHVPTELEVTMCARCGAHLVGNRWREAKGDAISDAARATTFSSIRIANLTSRGMVFLRPNQAPDVELSIEPKPKEGSIEVRARGNVHELQVQPQLEEVSIRFTLNRKTCDSCALKEAGHYEAILQVRGKLTRGKRSELRAVLGKLAARAGERERRAFISSIEERREGLDFYVNPASLARQMATLLKSEYGAELEESAKLVGRTKDGRRRYRISVLARIVAVTSKNVIGIRRGSVPSAKIKRDKS